MSWIDLSLTLEPSMMTTPAYWHPKVEFKQLGSILKEGRNTHSFILGTHTGTHMDAPYHFMKDGIKIDEVPIDLFVQDCALISLTNKKEGDRVFREDIEPFSTRLKGLKAVALCTGWSRRWMTKEYYGSWPHLEEGAAQYLLEKGIRLIAMDMPSPDSRDMIQPGQDSPIHKILMSKGVILVEYLTGLEQIKKEIFKLYVFPLKLKGLDGSPARVLAQV